MALTHTLGNVQIPAGMVWTDEFDWTPVVKSKSYSLTGALIVQTSLKQAGRPITLEASDDQGWHGMTREVLQQLRTMASNPTASYTLTLASGEAFEVIFSDDTPITARPLFRHENPPDDWPYVVTLKLLVI